MAFTAPTTKEINDNLISQLQASLNQTIPLLPRAFTRVLSKAIAGIFTLLYKYGGFIFLQMFVKTASFASTNINGTVVTPLIAWGELIGVGTPVASTQAELLIQIDVTTQIGSLPSGSQIINSATGITYLTVGGVLLNAATVTATIKAVTDQSGGNGSGSTGNADAGTLMNFVNPLSNVDREVTVLSSVTTAADGEEEDDYRQRVVDRWQKVPQGGAYADYEMWGEETAGIINVYPYTSPCPGQVDLYVEATEASSGSADGIPTSAQLQAVLDSVFLDSAGLATRRPVGALVNAFPIGRLSFTTVVSGLEVANQSVVQAQITEGIEQYFTDREPYILGLTIPPRLDRVTRSAVGGLIEDIVSASAGIFSGVVVSKVTQTLSGSVSTISHSVSGQEPAPDDITWSADGLKFFILGNLERVFEYAAPSPFILSGATYSGSSYFVNEDTDTKAVRFNTSGTKMYILGATNGRVYEYTLSVGFDLSSTITYTGSSFLITGQEATPTGMAFSSDGGKFFITGASAKVYEYTMSANFDLSSTVAHSGNFVDVSSQTAAPLSIEFKDQGQTMMVLGGTIVHQYKVFVPYGFGTDVDFTGQSVNVTTEEATPASVSLSDGRFFIVGAGATVYQYDLGVGSENVDLLTLGAGEKAKSAGVTFV